MSEESPAKPPQEPQEPAGKPLPTHWQKLSASLWTRATLKSIWRRGGILIVLILGALTGLIVANSIPEGWLLVTPEASADALADAHNHDEEAAPEVWACPMLCTRMDAPGKCPVCGMTLERFIDTGAALPLSESQRKALGVISETVSKRKLAREIRSYGEFKADETVEKVVSAWIGGRIERMYADYTGVAVEKGWHLFDIYSPELYSAQEELLLANKALAETPEEGPLRKSRERMKQLAQDKLELLGLSADQIAEIEHVKEAQLTLRIDSPAKGVVLEKLGSPGMYVQRGQPIYRIADLSNLWLIIDVHERDLGWIALGQEVEVSANALNGQTRTGRVGFIEPTLNRRTRTARIRVEVPNPNGDLRLGMYATATILAEMTSQAELAKPTLDGDFACPMHPLQRAEVADQDCPICGMKMIPQTHETGGKGAAVLAIPREAVLSTGMRHLVYAETLSGDFTEIDGKHRFIPGDATYSAFEVELGPLAYEWVVHDNGHRQRLGAYYPLLSGRAANPDSGDMLLIPGITRIVLNGQFLIDSQMELSGKPSLINAEAAEAVDPHAGHR